MRAFVLTGFDACAFRVAQQIAKWRCRQLHDVGVYIRWATKYAPIGRSIERIARAGFERVLSRLSVSADIVIRYGQLRQSSPKRIAVAYRGLANLLEAKCMETPRLCRNMLRRFQSHNG